MIEFNGELTGKSKKFLIRKQQKLQGTSAFLTIIVFTIPTVYLAFSWNITVLFMLIAYVFFFICSIIPPGKQSQKMFMPKRIFIDLEEGTIVNQCEKAERFHTLETIHKVIDYGEWYYFVFESSSRDMYFVCQKSLLTQGSLEEFEALFADKIEMKV